MFAKDLLREGVHTGNYRIVYDFLQDFDVEDATLDNLSEVVSSMSSSDNRIRTGDLIMSIDGHPVKGRQDIMLYLHKNKKPKDIVKVKYKRFDSGKMFIKEKKIVLKKFPDKKKK